MTQQSKCQKCGSEREALYEVNWIPVYYCPGCGATDHGPASELYGPEERAIDEAGEYIDVRALVYEERELRSQVA